MVPPRLNALESALSGCRVQFGAVGVFSLVVNLLQLTVSLYMMQVFDRVLATRSLDTLLWLTVVAIAAIGLLALLDGVRAQVMQRVAIWLEGRVAPEGFARALEATLRNRPYRMEVLRDLGTCRAWLSGPGALALYDVPWVPVYLFVIYLLHPILFYIAAGGAVVLFGLALASELATAAPLRRANVAAMATQRRADAIARNAEAADAMGMVPALLRLWRAGVAEAAPLQQQAADRAALLSALTKFVRLAVQIAVLGVGAWLTLRQDMTSGAAIAGSIIMGRALAPVEQLIGGWKGLVQVRQAYRRLLAFLAQPRLRPEAEPLPAPTGRLSAERLTWAPPGQQSAVIKGVTFALEPGESLAIIGPSGSGKTTLLRLLVGTLAPLSGHARLDGADLSTWPREDVGRHIGYLPQDVELFEGTVFRNIARLDPEALPEAVHRAARLAGCHEAILRLPQGYETELAEGALSGGQRQMVGLARALYGDPRLVILDEPDSSLDGDAEARFLEGLAGLKAIGATVVLVSHRPSLVRGVDKVLVMRDGAAELFGPRAEVLARLSARPVTPNAPPNLPQPPGNPPQAPKNLPGVAA
ncbi:type I secretion system permease/ATPase [Roseomonas sp. SSH11]|uniref:Type I secretion system permease/ATPase n=2 Tax=Pararoseomonas baculiformis TaxID=2820812 RepID=A0ABS4ALH4_9PROT|nr:type I secretion system permease/ATPase [Pararoseomonas baculiformis]MBP0447884.1 type I secretion system permease/ATPase [Pararoseomonas baculiformis]